MIARTIALFVAILALGNLLGDLLWPGFDANIWWINLRLLPVWVGNVFLAVAALPLMVFAFRSSRGTWSSLAAAVSALLLAIVSLTNVASFYGLLITDRIAAGFPIPLSLLVFAGMLLVIRAAMPHKLRMRRSISWVWIVTGSLCLFGAFPLALMLFFGNTDYRRPADAVVVFGARAYADGRLSDALEDRVRTACELYRTGLAKRLVFSGGPGDGSVHETAAMRRYAIQHGVRSEDIFVDEMGLNTAATVRNTVPLLQQWHARSVLAVSHFYHLPRIKLCYQRAGLDVRTVPARQKYLMSQMPYNMAREVAAFWVYYLKQRPAGVSMR
jgi:uncharacterized SAM-binding protein YcdF (DUF218 family)